MTLTTTDSIEGKQITHYLGIIVGTTYTSNTAATKGMSFKDMFSATKYYENYEKGLEEAKENAFEKVRAQAKEKQANAVVGITIDIEMMSTTGVTVISVSGTAVRVQ